MIEQPTQNTPHSFLRIATLLFLSVALATLGWWFYGVSHVAETQKKLTQSEQKIADLEEALGLRNELYANSVAEYGVIAEFAGATKDAVRIKLKIMDALTPEMQKSVEQGGKPTLTFTEKVISGKIDKATLFPVKKLEDFKVGDLVKATSRIPIQETDFLMARMEPYVENATTTPPIPKLPAGKQ